MKSWHTLRLLPRLCLAIAVSLVSLAGIAHTAAFAERRKPNWTGE